MKRIATVVGLLLLFAGAGRAQTTNPQPSQETLQLNVGASALGLTGGGKADPGTDIVLKLNVKGDFALRSDNILVPSATLQVYAGGFQYPFLTKQIAKTTLKGLEPYVTASAAAVHLVPTTGPSTNHIGFMAGGGLNWTPAGGVKINVFELRYADFPGYGRKPVVSGGIGYVFGHQ